MRSQAEKAAAFRALHDRPGAFIIPNPWEAGTAKVLAALGFEALATTSSGLAQMLGRATRVTRAEAALASLRDGREAVRGLQTGIAGEISLALVGTLADTQIVGVLRQFAARAKGVKLELRTATSRGVTDLVRRGEATLGLRYHASERPELVSLHAGDEAMLVAAAPGHPLAGRRVRKTSLLAGERWIGFPPTPGERDSGQVLAQQLIRAGLDGAEVTLIDSLTAQKRLAQAGFGLTLVPESSVRDELRQGSLVALDIPAMRTSIPIAAIHRRNGYLSPAAKVLLGLLTGGTRKPRAPPHS